MKSTLLEEAFLREGYTAVPFTFNGAGHPLITALINGNKPIQILLDTGASANLLDYQFAKTLGLTLIPTGEKGGGAGGLTLDVFSIEQVSIRIHELEFAFTDFLSMDFTSIKESLHANGLAADFQGILGFGFFKRTESFIDYSLDRIFIRKEPAT